MNCWWTALDPVYGELLVMNQSTAHALYIHRCLALNVGHTVGHTTSQKDLFMKRVKMEKPGVPSMRLDLVSDFFVGFLKMGFVVNKTTKKVKLTEPLQKSSIKVPDRSFF